MNKKNIFTYSIITLFLLGFMFVFVKPLFTNFERNLEKENSDIVINSDELISSFKIDEEKANELYKGKIIEVIGIVKEVSFLNNRNTVLLYTKNKDSEIICDVHASQIEKIKTLKKDQKIRVKGICKGFLKDVILLNCSIDLLPNE